MESCHLWSCLVTISINNVINQPENDSHLMLYFFIVRSVILGWLGGRSRWFLYRYIFTTIIISISILNLLLLLLLTTLTTLL